MNRSRLVLDRQTFLVRPSKAIAQPDNLPYFGGLVPLGDQILHHMVAGSAGNELHEGPFPPFPSGLHARERVALDEVGSKELVDDSGVACFACSVDSFEVTPNELLVLLGGGHDTPEATTRCIDAATGRQRPKTGI